VAALPPLARSRQRRRSLAAPAPKAEPLHPEQRLLLLDTWQRSKLPAADFAALVGISRFTLFAWKKKFEQECPAGLLDKPKGTPAGSRLPDLTKRTILWGVCTSEVVRGTVGVVGIGVNPCGQLAAPECAAPGPT
jgi:hypothetical protein